MSDSASKGIYHGDKDTTHNEGSKMNENVNKPGEFIDHNIASNPSKPNHSQTVANHYNTLDSVGLDIRYESPIFYLRNFNNWIKGMLITEFLAKLKSQRNHKDSIRVLDMCCGKGGDLRKWQIGGISHLICTDIASVSIGDCEERYKQMKTRAWTSLFSAEFIVADCTTVRLKDLYKAPEEDLDLVNCQFAFHYGFESLPQAERLLLNASESLRPGGYFIGTIPDAFQILSRLRKENSDTFGNNIFNIKLQFNPENGIPLFGAKYNFHLEGVVDCPEFLVHFPTFVELAKKCDLKLVFKKGFDEYFREKKEEGVDLIKRMQCFETYPPITGMELIGKASGDYEHAVRHLAQNNMELNSDHKSSRRHELGTISKSEWEAASLYTIFAFQKENSKKTDANSAN